MCLCMNVYGVRMCSCLCMLLCVRASSVCTFVHEYVYVCMLMCLTYENVFLCVYVGVHVCVFIYICVCLCVYAFLLAWYVYA